MNLLIHRDLVRMKKLDSWLKTARDPSGREYCVRVDLMDVMGCVVPYYRLRRRRKWSLFGMFAWKTVAGPVVYADDIDDAVLVLFGPDMAPKIKN